MAHRGHTGEEERQERRLAAENTDVQGAESRASSGTRVAGYDGPLNETSGVKADPEKGKDVYVVDWF